MILDPVKLTVSIDHHRHHALGHYLMSLLSIFIGSSFSVEFWKVNSLSNIIVLTLVL